MTIKIKLTNKEFDAINAIHNGQRWNLDVKATTPLKENSLISIEACGWCLTWLGILAWEQNRPKEPKGEKPKDVAYTECVEFWLKSFHIGWTFGAVQGKALKSILAKLREQSTDRTDATIVATFKKMCQSLPIWFTDKDLPVLNSKLNEIITQIQRGTKLFGYNQQNSAERFFTDYGK
jgi:hypothetical protein